MAFLLDTSILVQLANASDIQHPMATAGVLELHRRGEALHITPQVLIEFRSAATRPKSANGAGLPVADAEIHASAFEGKLALLPDTPAIFPAWKSLVSTLGVIGKQVHEVCHVHGVTHLLTFNTGHFARLAAFAPGVVVVDPATL